jgi:subtilase family serine protease
VEAKPAPALSDVVVKDIAFERNEVGQVRLAALVANIGQAQTGDMVGVAFFVDDGYATFGAIPPLPAGESQAVRAVQPLSLSGSHKITAFVDDVNRFPEESEENNTLTEQIDFGAPGPHLADTIILNVTMGQGRFSEGDAITIEAVVRNIGSAPTGGIVGVAFLIDDRYITFGTTAPIPPGETRNVRSVTTWQAVAGQHRLVAIVDDVNRYPEISEANNYFALDFQVMPGDEAQLPDSTVESIDFETDPSGQVVLTATVANIGPVPTPNVVGVAFFIDGQYITYGVAQPMPAGATETIRAIKPLSLKGAHTITAIVDDVNRYDELSHQNNALTREIRFTN